MAKVVEFSKLAESITWYYNEEYDKYKSGIWRDLTEYIKKYYPKALEIKNDRTFVDMEALGDLGAFVNRYLRKADRDFSAADITAWLLSRAGIPPINEMSFNSLKKTVLERFNMEESEILEKVKKGKKGKKDGKDEGDEKEEDLEVFKDNVYLRKGKGGKWVACLSFEDMQRLVKDRIIQELLRGQIARAERKHQNKTNTNDEWLIYELWKEWIETQVGCMPEQIKEDDEADEMDKAYDVLLSQDDKMRMMIEALFSHFFTSFDFIAYCADKKEYDIMFDNHIFTDKNGKLNLRYKELRDTFADRNYLWRYYQPKGANDLMDDLAERVAEKILKKLNSEES